jgi:hypothetical protein
MFITLYWKTLESPWPDMTTTAVIVCDNDAHGSSIAMHKLAQSCLMRWLQNKGKVIRGALWQHSLKRKKLRSPGFCETPRDDRCLGSLYGMRNRVVDREVFSV